MTEADLEFRRRPPAAHAAAIDGLHRFDERPGLAAECARVHRQRAAHGAGDAGEEFGAGEIEPGAIARHLVAGDAGAGAHRAVVELRELVERTGGGDDRARHAAVAHQQVAAEAQPQHRLVGGDGLQEQREVVDIRGLVITMGNAADPPGVVARERFVVPQYAAQCALRRHHASSLSYAGSFAAAAPMSPAPRVSSTSPSRSTPRSTLGRVASSLTNTGSTWPRARMARLKARPSAPATGASPAA